MSLLLWKGRLFFKQYIPTKHSRFGIKLYVLCDALTYIYIPIFLYMQVVYTHNDTLGKSGSIVTSLLDAYLDKRHVLHVDNFLLARRTGTYGTIRTNHKEMPKFTKKLNKEETECHHSTELLALK